MVLWGQAGAKTVPRELYQLYQLYRESRIHSSSLPAERALQNDCQSVAKSGLSCLMA